MITGAVLAFPVGVITGIFGQRAGLSMWINGIMGGILGIAVMMTCFFAGLP